MRSGIASGTQIAVLVFAVLLLAVPLSSWLAGILEVRAAVHRDLLGRLVGFAAGALLIVSIAPLRRAAAAELAKPVPADRRAEILAAIVLRLILALGVSGAIAWWIWATEGNAALAFRTRRDPVQELAYAFSPEGMFFFLVLGGIVAPLVEELVFRGFLYRAWERSWGWFPSMVAVSIVFGLYHPNFANSFVASVLFVCVLRRTGTLWGPIVVHAAGNALLWFPFAGQLVFPSADRAAGDITNWGLQLACFLALVTALPFYVWMARDERPSTAHA